MAIALNPLQRSHAQSLGSTAPDPKLVAASATAAGFGSIYSPNLFDGSANVSIPIYDFSNDYGSYGISLGYNTKGVKVDEIAGVAGLHWSVQAEGSISRVVKDIPDELNMEAGATIFVGTEPSNGNEIHLTNYNRYLRGKLATYKETTAQKAQTDAYRDGECDDFIFSAGGSSFTFNIGKDGQFFTNPHRNIAVTMYVDGVAVVGTAGTSMPLVGTEFGPVVTFRVRDEQGNTYDFIPGDYEKRTLFDNYYGGDDFIIDSYFPTKWVISKITFANGNYITYSYTTRQNNSTSYKQYRQYSVREYMTATYQTDEGGALVSMPAGSFIQLSGISYPNGITAALDYSTDANEAGQKMLNTVRITGGGKCLKYNLAKTKVNERWVLNNIKMQNCSDATEEPYYTFEYDPLTLPHRLNPGQDWFGYFNNDSVATTFTSGSVTQPKMMIPKHRPLASPPVVNYGANRTNLSVYARASLLKKVTNAYGGSTQFFYGSHSLSNTLTAITGLAGDYYMESTAPDGLRVDSIHEIDRYHPENTKVTRFTYTNGQIFTPGGHFHMPDFFDSTANALSRIMFQNMYLTPHHLINGSNHGYSNVKVETFSGSTLVGRRDILFSNVTDAGISGNRYYKVTGSKHYFEYPYADKQYLRDWEIGLPLMVTEYDANNRIVQRTTNTYDFTLDLSANTYITNTKTARVKHGHIKYFGMAPGTPYYPNKKIYTDTYYPYTGYANLTKTKVEKFIDDTRTVADSSLYVYDSRNNLKEVHTWDSKDRYYKNRTVYNYDIAGPGVTGGPAAGSALYNMTLDGLEKVVSTERLRKPTAFSTIYNDVVHDVSVTGYTYTAGRLLTNKLWVLRGATPPYSTYSGLTAPGYAYNKIKNLYAGTAEPLFKEVSAVTLADAKGNPLENRMLGIDVYKAMVWDTISGRKLAEASDCRSADMAYTSFEAMATGSNLTYNAAQVMPAEPSVSGTNVYYNQSGITTDIVGTQDLSNTKEYLLSFWFMGGVPRVYVGTNAIAIPYLTAEVGIWKNCQIRFTPTATGKLKITGPAGGAGIYFDEIRLHPSDAVMQSWTYNVLQGMTSATDATGRLSYMEYDNQGRQTIIRNQEGSILSKKQFIVDGAE